MPDPTQATDPNAAPPASTDPAPYVSNIQGAIAAYKAAGSPPEAKAQLQQVISANYSKIQPTGYFETGDGAQLGHILRGSWGVNDPAQGASLHGADGKYYTQAQVAADPMGFMLQPTDPLPPKAQAATAQPESAQAPIPPFVMTPQASQQARSNIGGYVKNTVIPDAVGSASGLLDMASRLGSHTMQSNGKALGPQTPAQARASRQAYGSIIPSMFGATGVSTDPNDPQNGILYNAANALGAQAGGQAGVLPKFLAGIPAGIARQTVQHPVQQALAVAPFLLHGLGAAGEAAGRVSEPVATVPPEPVIKPPAAPLPMTTKLIARAGLDKPVPAAPLHPAIQAAVNEYQARQPLPGETPGIGLTPPPAPPFKNVLPVQKFPAPKAVEPHPTADGENGAGRATDGTFIPKVEETPPVKEPWQMTPRELESLPDGMADKHAFGMNSGDVIQVHPRDLVPSPDDLENAQYQQEQSGLSPKKWAQSVDLSEPIDASLQDDGKIHIDDGNHRYLAAKILDKPLSATIELKGNPIKSIYQKALAEGKSIPAEAYKDYPDLKPPAAQSAPPEQSPAIAPQSPPAALPAPSEGMPEPAESGLVPNFPVSKLKTDPERFQYKIGSGQGGQTGSLSGAKSFNQDLAGVVHAWHDPVDGNNYVVNGHNRFALAQKTGQPSLDVRFLDAADAAEARTKGAMINIAEGQGTAIDAAKMFREQGVTPEEISSKGISLKGQKAQQGLALANLSPSLFGQVVRGELPIERGALIGEKLPDVADQQLLTTMLDKQAAKGKSPTNDVISEMADQIRNGPRNTETNSTLFGDDTTSKSTALERAEVAAYIKNELGKEGAVFGQAAKNADRLARGNNVIDADTSAKIAGSSRQGAELFDRTKNSAGVTSDILNKAAERIAKGENSNAVKSDALNQFREAIPNLAKGANEPGAGESLPISTGDGDVRGSTQGTDLFASEPAAPLIPPEKSLRAKVTPAQAPAAPPVTSVTPKAEAAPIAAPTTAEGHPAEPTEPDKPTSGPAVLQSSILPGVPEFIEHDVVPILKAAARGVASTAADVKSALSPSSVMSKVETTTPTTSGSVTTTTMRDFAPQTGRIIRDNAAELALKRERAKESLKGLSKAFDKTPAADQLKFIDNMENGRPQATPDLNRTATLLRTALDTRRTEIQNLGTGKLQNFIADYFPHLWEDPKKAQSVFGQVFGKRPLEGPKSFLKKRTIPTTADGIAAGLKPITTNPVDLALLKMHEMDRYVMGQKVIQEMKAGGIAKFVRAQERPPDGYTKIDDRVAQVYESRPTTKANGDPGAPELILRGHYYAPDAAAKVINQYLSPGLRGKSLFDLAQGVGNTLNQAQLGMSAFHLGFVSLDAATSKFALGGEQLSRGLIGKGLANSAKGVIPLYAPIESFVRGDKVLREALNPGSQGADIAQIVDALQAGGGRVRMDDFYKNSAVESFWKALRQGNYPGAIARTPGAIIEKLASPIMEQLVPRMKMGIFADMAADELSRLPANASRDQVRNVMAKAWDSVDNRMGQMVYDNLFWNKTYKDLAMVTTRSLGWNLGTWRELGGGAMDTANIVSRVKAGGPAVTHRMAYIAALPAITAIYGAMYQYLHTGKGPQDLKDYFAPRTGRTNPDGTPERVQLPTYMKDITPFVNAARNGGGSGVAQQTQTTLTNKLNPQFSMIADMLQNKDFYNTEIRNHDDPLYKQLADTFAFGAKQFVPFSITNAMKRSETGAGLEPKAEGFVGITPAPAATDRTRAQQMMIDDIQNGSPAGVKTQVQFQLSQITRGIKQQERQGQNTTPQVVKMIQSGQITRRQGMNILRQGQQTPDEVRLKAITLPQALQVYDAGNASEKSSWKLAMELKLRAAARSHTLTLPQVAQARKLGIIPK